MELQYFQELHDRRYHLDIYAKPLCQRVAHLHQHLVKYSVNEMKQTQTFHDTLACLLSMSNAINVNLTNAYATRHQGVFSLEDLLPIYHDSYIDERYRQKLAEIAKLLEGTDHTEPVNFRERLTEYLLDLFVIIAQKFTRAEHSVNEVVLSYIRRIFEIKQRNMFFPFYHIEDLKIPAYAGFTEYYTNITSV